MKVQRYSANYQTKSDNGEFVKFDEVKHLIFEWISVKDKLPEVGKWYLAATYTDCLALFKKKKIVHHLFCDSISTERRVSWLCTGEDADWFEEVTHFQELPDPPKEA